jgi:NADPH2:quinone reductase
VVNHREPGWAERALELNGGEKVHQVIEVDFGANIDEVLVLIRTGGTIASYASMSNPEPRIPFYRMMYLDLAVRTVIVYDMPESAKMQAMQDIDKAMNAGWLKHRIAYRLPLAEIAQAHELIEQGSLRGCVVLDVA